MIYNVQSTTAWLIRAGAKSDSWLPNIVEHNFHERVTTLAYGDRLECTHVGELKTLEGIFRSLGNDPSHDSASKAINRFVNKISLNDVVLLPYGVRDRDGLLGKEILAAIGIIVGNPVYDARQIDFGRLSREVVWLHKNIDKEQLDQDIQNSIRRGTIHQILPNSRCTGSRLLYLALQGTDPGPADAWTPETRQHIIKEVKNPLIGGKPYQKSAPNMTQSKSTVFEIDPDAIDRGTSAHYEIESQLAKAVSEASLRPLEPKANDPKFDLAWHKGDTVFLAEVKSTTNDNVEKQLRLGLGQVLRYAHLLEQQWTDVRTVRPVLAIEQEPRDQNWKSLCERHDVILTWPSSFHILFS